MGPAITIAWCMTSLQPANKTVVGIALINAMSQIGLVIGPCVCSHNIEEGKLTSCNRYAWDQSWGPSYRKSFAICLAAASLSIVMSFVFRYHLAGLNAKAEKEEKDRGQTEPGFRYML